MKSVILVLLFCGAVFARSYSTSFTLTENPISESGNWINGKLNGLDWQNVQTVPGLSFGTLINLGYDDSTALITGTWGADQRVKAIVYVSNPSPSYSQEVELRLRSSISAHVCTGYEINFSVVEGYEQIVRWNGPLGDFTVLSGSGQGAHNGDTIEASMTGNVITVFKNGVQIDTVTDNGFSSGNPGIGFFTRNGDFSKFGFTSVLATDSTSGIPPSVPTGLTIH